jgi:hypothetical protein
MPESADGPITLVVATLLRERAPRRLCADCLATELATAFHYVQEATEVLANRPGFMRLAAICDGCRRRAIVMTADATHAS